MGKCFGLISVLALLLSNSFGAVAYGQTPVRIVEVGPVEARSASTFGNVFGVAALANNRLLVNDAVQHRLLILDTSLRPESVLLDSIASGPRKYGARALPLIPYIADSVLFIDLEARALQLIDPNGQVARVISIPTSADLFSLMTSPSTTDTRGNLFYRRPAPGLRRIQTKSGAIQFVMPTDSTPIMRVNFETRKSDSIAKIKVAAAATVYSGTDGRNHELVDPVQAVDDWAVLSDGSIALARGHDYHIDFVDPAGKTFSSPKIAL